MAKATAKAKAKGPTAADRAKAAARNAAETAARNKAEAAAAARARARKPKTWPKVVALIILFPFAAVLLPTTLVFVVMMAPTWVAYVTDRSRDKQLAITVGMLNFAGTLPAIIELWTRGQSHEIAMQLIGDVFAWAQAYGAAFLGWGLFAVMPTLVASFYRMTTDSRIKGLVKQQKALIAEWGHAVAEGIAPAPMPGDEEDEDGDEAAEEDAEVTEAALVQPQRGG